MNALPVLFGSTISHTWTPGANFAIPFDSRRLVNTYRVPIEVTELRWVVKNRTVSALGILGSNLGLLLAARVWSGHDKITGDNPAPLAAFGPPIQACRFGGGAAGVALFSNGEIEPPTVIPALGGAVTMISAFHFRWVLPRPMVLPPGEAVLAQLEANDLGAGIPAIAGAPFTADVTFSVVGRYMATPVPRTRWVPYLSAYQWRQIVTGAVAAPEARHPQRIFQSPWPGKTLHVQRFLGRIVGIYAAEGANIDVVDLSAEYPTFFGPPAALNMRVLAPRGYAGYVDPIPLERMFDVQRRVWNAPHDLENQQDLWTFIYENPSNRRLPMIALVGHREEALS